LRSVPPFGGASGIIWPETPNRSVGTLPSFHVGPSRRPALPDAS
jgi:hypothetical protein